MEFLASEFSKETQNPRSIEQKDLVEIETVDSTMLEVASVQGINEQSDAAADCTVIDEANTACQVFSSIFFPIGTWSLINSFIKLGVS